MFTTNQCHDSQLLLGNHTISVCIQLQHNSGFDFIHRRHRFGARGEIRSVYIIEFCIRAI